MTHRTFEIAHRQITGEPLTFSLHSKEGEESPRYTVHLDRIPGSMCYGLETAWGLFQKAMDQDEYVAFRSWIDDVSRSVESEDIVAIANWIIEERTGRPTQQSSFS